MERRISLAQAGKRTFAALTYPNYRLWFFGQMTSLFGTWMQSTAQGYLVYELTHSEAYLGYVGCASGIASWVFMLYGGVIADRVPRRNLLVVTQSLSMLLAFVLSALTFTHTIMPWHIVLLAFALGVVNAFDAPTRQSFVLEMVERPVLPNAIALNSMMFNTAMTIGPAIGGLAYALFGPGWCFAMNGLSFVAVIASLLSMKLPAWRPPEKMTSALTDIRLGLRTVVADRRILSIICLMSMVNLFGMSFATLMPAWAVQVLGGDASTYGFLQCVRGLGALLAALAVAALSHRRFKGKAMTIGSIVFPVFVMLFSLTHTVVLSLAALFMVGASNILMGNLANALVQIMTPDALRGRVMAVYMLAFFGFAPLGALFAGGMATLIGVPLTIGISALCMLGCSLTIALSVPTLRRLH
jgi:MFS family permease